MTPQFLNDSYTISIQCSRPSTGEVYDATGSPAYEIYEDATSTVRASGSLSKTNSKTGYYTASLTLNTGTGFVVGHSYSVRVTATVDSIPAGGIVDRFILRYAPASLDVKVPGYMSLAETMSMEVQLLLGGIPTNADGTVSYEVLNNAQAAIQSGTLSTHVDTGVYSGTVVLSTGNGFAAGTGYTVRVTAAVGGTSVGGVASLHLRNPIASDAAGVVTSTATVTGTVVASNVLAGGSPGIARIP